jgi:hypothetical protein
MLDTLLLHDILMMEVLNCSKHVLTVAKRDGFLTFFITSNLLPDISEHHLLILESHWTNKSKRKEQFGHLSASYLNVASVFFSLVRFTYDSKIQAGSSEVLIEAIVHELVRLGPDLNSWNLWFGLEVVLSLLSCLVPVLGVMDQVVHSPIQNS